MTTINSVSNFSSMPKINFKQATVSANSEVATDKNDKIDLAQKAQKPEPPEISTSRLLWGRLTDEQIRMVNESGRLPENAKFVMSGFGSYAITTNFFNFRAGTRELPAGFEVKKDIFGFTTVLPKGMEGACIKSV